MANGTAELEHRDAGTVRSLGNAARKWRRATSLLCAIVLGACGTAAPDGDAGVRPAPTTSLTPLPPSELPDAGASAPTVAPEAGPAPENPPQNPPDDAGTKDAGAPRLGALSINEVMSQNDGAWIDELGEADDWLELVNASSEALELSDYRIADTSGVSARLPAMTLDPGARVVLFADDSPEQGPLHLPFKLSASGDRLRLFTDDDVVSDEVTLPALSLNETLARFPDGSGEFYTCRYASPGRANGESCTPPPPPSLSSEVEFEAYEHPSTFPPSRSSLVIAELSLRPAAGEPAFVELLNASSSAVALDDYQLNLSPHKPHQPWPDVADGHNLSLPSGISLEPSARIALEVPTDVLDGLESDPEFEGVLTLLRGDEWEPTDRIDFMHWPVGAALSRIPDASPVARFCTNTTQGAANVCQQLATREVGNRVRALRTPGDFSRLAEGANQLGIAPVKFVADLEAPGLVHLLAAARWPLHYTFVRERIYQQPVLDRCDPDENAEFYQGWVDFSAREYYATSGRRFHLGTLVRHAGASISSIEFTTGDAISADGMREAFYTVVEHTQDPSAWVLRPQGDDQVARAREIEGSLPLVSPSAPFENVTYQPLTEGVAYGTLRFITATALEQAALGPHVIVVTDDVPNDIPLVGGLVTEAFQTPLAHVNVLSQNRGTPNASLVEARNELADYFDELVRLEVSASGLSVELADPAEAAAFWDERKTGGPVVAPRLDTSLRGVQPLDAHDLSSLPAIGAKAAQLAELARVDISVSYCSERIRPTLPDAPFAIPVVHYVEHFEESGASELIDELKLDPEFVADPGVRSQGLLAVRELILTHPVEPALLRQVEDAVFERHATRRVRFRSSSNTEDLPSFNGAGLYTSISAELGDSKRRVDDALRTVWSSLWNLRAYDERSYANIDDSRVAMGILVHPASLSEEANGVGVSRNVLDPDRGDIYYLNNQAGEASVTNPAPGVTTEQLVYRWGRSPPLVYHGESSLLEALADARDTVLSKPEVEAVSCALRGIHAWFQPLLDPEAESRWFAMEIEFKLRDQDRLLVIKQARPHSFGRPEYFGDCREL